MISLEKYFYIDNIHQINLEYIKKTKAKVILRTQLENKIDTYKKFISNCNSRRIEVFIYNDVKLLFKLKSNNLYISSFNRKNFNHLKYINRNIKIIGSAHNISEINQKFSQGCNKIILSRIFKTYKKGYLDLVKFNKSILGFKNIIALGGINSKNYKKLKMIKIEGFAMLSEIKNYPDFLITA